MCVSRYSPLLLVLASIAMLGHAGCTTSSGKLVTVRSIVDPSYLQQRAERTPASPETFVLSPGRMMTGAGYNRELANTDFSAIAATLTADLARAGYRPAADRSSADLLVMVHWGITERIEREADLLAYDPDNLRLAQEALEEARAKAAADAGTINAIQSRGAVSAAEAALRSEANHAASLFGGNELQTASNADLLGFREVLQASDNALAPTAAGETLRALADEERYFVVLIAYEAKAALLKQRKRVWTTRMSISAAGQNFRTGLDRMSYTASTSHGAPQAGILIAPSVGRPAAPSAATSTAQP